MSGSDEANAGVDPEWLHGGDLVSRQLSAEGIRHIFTLTGGHISALYDGARFANLKLIDFRHEQAAVHAADAFARLTRRTACAALTAGPGVTGGVTGVANAYYAQSPVLVIGGRNPLMTEGAGNLQDAPHLELMRPVTKFSAAIYDYGRSCDVIHEAVQATLNPRFGPAYVDLPMDFQLTRLPLEMAPPIRAAAVGPKAFADPDVVRAVAEQLAGAKKPVILAGTGLYWSGSWELLGLLAETLRVPVFLNGMARGALGRGNPFQLQRVRRAALTQTDCLLMLGADFDFRLGYGQPGVVHPQAKVIQVDPQSTTLGRNRDVDSGIAADIGAFLEQLLGHSGRFGRSTDSDWLAELRDLERAADQKSRRILEGEQFPIHPDRLVQEVADLLDESTITIGDGGDIVGAFAGVYRPGGPGAWMDPGPFGCLGVGAPFAIGARVANPDRPIAVMFGDGAFGFNGFEYDSAVRQNLPFVGIVGNDGAWSEMRTFHADMFGEEDRSAQYLSQSTRYDKVVEGLGGFGQRVERASQIRPAVEKAFSSGVPALIDVVLDPTVRRQSGTISGRQVAAAYGEGDHDAFRRPRPASTAG